MNLKLESLLVFITESSRELPGVLTIISIKVGNKAKSDECTTSSQPCIMQIIIYLETRQSDKLQYLQRDRLRNKISLRMFGIASRR